VLLTREYAAGLHRYELGLPRGRVDPGESLLEGAQRELKEETGFGAHELLMLRTLSLAPTYMSHIAHVLLARDLYEERLPGDEPEEIEVVPWKIDDLHELLTLEEFSEGRAMAALFLAREWLRQDRGE
jgi:ADP-ribose diphosphatase